MKDFIPPTWAEANCVTIFTDILNCNLSKSGALDRVSANNKVAEFLNNNGWSFTEGSNVVEHGYTLNFRKPTGIVNGAKEPHPYLHFQWYWDNCGGPDFWRGNLWTSYGYDRDFKYLGPVGFFEIRDILERYLNDLYQYERQLVHALISQTPISNGSR